MKIYAIIGTSEQIVDSSTNPECSAGCIEMQSERPSIKHIAQADGTWLYSLDMAKAEKWQEIRALCEQKEQEGFPYMGKMFYSDSHAIQRIGITSQAAQVSLQLEQEFSAVWHTQDGAELVMTAQEVLGIPLALNEYRNDMYAKAGELKGEIDAAQTVEEIEAVTWE